MISFKQIIDLFQQLQTESNFLNSFYEGLPWEMSKDKSVNYPTMFLERPDNNTQNYEAGLIETWNIAFYILDRTIEDKSLITLNLNQSNKYAKLIVNKLFNYFEEDDDFDSLSQVIYTKWEDTTPDLCHGWRVSFSISGLFEVDDCIEIIKPTC